MNCELIDESRLVYDEGRVSIINDTELNEDQAKAVIAEMIDMDGSVLASEPPREEPAPEASHNSGEDPSGERT